MCVAEALSAASRLCGRLEQEEQEAEERRQAGVRLRDAHAPREERRGGGGVCGGEVTEGSEERRR